MAGPAPRRCLCEYARFCACWVTHWCSDTFPPKRAGNGPDQRRSCRRPFPPATWPHRSDRCPEGTGNSASAPAAAPSGAWRAHLKGESQDGQKIHSRQDLIKEIKRSIAGFGFMTARHTAVLQGSLWRARNLRVAHCPCRTALDKCSRTSGRPANGSLGARPCTMSSMRVCTAPRACG